MALSTTPPRVWGEVEVVAADDVREYVAAHGGRVFVWVRLPRGLLFTPCLLETSLEPPRKRDLAFRRLRGPGFDVSARGARKAFSATHAGVGAPPAATRRGVLERHGLDRLTRRGVVAGWLPKSMGTTPVTDVPTDVEMVAADDVRDFVTAHGGRLYVWISVHHGFRCALCLLEVSSERPRNKDLYFRRIKGPGFDVYLEASQRHLAEDAGVRRATQACRGLLERSRLDRLTRPHGARRTGPGCRG